MRNAFDHAPNGVPFIAKIDVEGFEKDLFSNNTEWLADVFVVHIEPRDWMLPGAGSSFTFQRALAAYAFEIFITGDTDLHKAPLAPHRPTSRLSLLGAAGRHALSQTTRPASARFAKARSVQCRPDRTSPAVGERPASQKSPRRRSKAHLAFVREQPCRSLRPEV